MTDPSDVTVGERNLKIYRHRDTCFAVCRIRPQAQILPFPEHAIFGLELLVGWENLPPTDVTYPAYGGVQGSLPLRVG